MATHDLYDRLESRAPAARESALLRDLAHVLSVSRSRVPSLRAQLKGVDLAGLRTRADLLAIPLRRRADLLAAQRDEPAFGGYAATRTAALQNVFLGPDGLFALAGHAKDWWGFARAMQAAGLRKGTLVLNTLPYDLVPFGHMVDSGARAIGCPVIPAGTADVDKVAAIAARLAPRFFCGTAETLKTFLDAHEGRAKPALERALLIGPLKQGLRNEFAMRGVAVRLVSVLPELGVLAFESGTTDGMTLIEGLLLEIVDPQTGQPVGDGGDGEMVLSRVNVDYPLLRYATGLRSRILQQPATCGRTNTRIAVPQALDAPATEPAHMAEIRRRHPEYRMRLCLVRSNGALHLKVEHDGDGAALLERLAHTLHEVTRSGDATVELVTPGSLRDDDTSGDGRPA